MQTWTKCRKNIHTMNPHNRILSSFQIFNLSCLQLTALKLGSGDLLQVIDISISFLMFCRWYSVVDIAKIFVYLVTFRLQFVWKCCWHFLCNLFDNVVDIFFAGQKGGGGEREKGKTRAEGRGQVEQFNFVLCISGQTGQFDKCISVLCILYLCSGWTIKKMRTFID